MTTEQELCERHIRLVLYKMSNAVENRQWETVVELSAEMEMLASKQAQDESTITGRYGKR